MLSDSLPMVLLFDIYGSLLTEKQRTCFDLAYNQDFSLSEIGEECGISRQGVHDTLQRTEQALLTWESALGCGERELRLRKAEEKLLLLAEHLADCPEEAGELRSIVALLQKE